MSEDVRPPTQDTKAERVFFASYNGSEKSQIPHLPTVLELLKDHQHPSAKDVLQMRAVSAHSYVKSLLDMVYYGKIFGPGIEETGMYSEAVNIDMEGTGKKLIFEKLADFLVRYRTGPAYADTHPGEKNPKFSESNLYTWKHGIIDTIWKGYRASNTTGEPDSDIRNFDYAISFGPDKQSITDLCITKRRHLTGIFTGVIVEMKTNGKPDDALRSLHVSDILGPGSAAGHAAA